VAIDSRRLLHDLVESIDEANLGTAQAFLEFLATRRGDPVVLRGKVPDSVGEQETVADLAFRVFLDAPEDDEELSQDDIEAIEEGKADVAAGRVVTREEIEQRWPPRS
jgi:hypothetical protein